MLTPFGTELESLGDTVLTASGAMFVGATDSDDHEKLFELSGQDEFFEVGEPELIYRIAMGASKRHSIFTGTLTVNQHGDFAYLGEIREITCAVGGRGDPCNRYQGVKWRDAISRVLIAANDATHSPLF